MVNTGIAFIQMFVLYAAEVDSIFFYHLVIITIVLKIIFIEKEELVIELK